MKKGIALITIISYLCFFNISLSANSHSIDLEAGSSQFLSITNGDQTGLGITGDFTIEAWIKTESSSEQEIFSKNNTTTEQGGYSFKVGSDGKVAVEWLSTGAWSAETFSVYTTESVQITNGSWFHTAVTVNVSETSTAGIIYINSSAVTTVVTGGWDNASSVYDNTSTACIGADFDGANKFFDGLIDEVRVWNDIRTPTEIADNYEQELVGNEAGLVGYWKLNNGLLDETSNNNDLTNNNSATFSTDVPFSGAVVEVQNKQDIIWFD